MGRVIRADGVISTPPPMRAKPRCGGGCYIRPQITSMLILEWELMAFWKTTGIITNVLAGTGQATV